MTERNSPLNAELQKAFDNPENYDWGFEDEREERGLANFDFDPAEAERMRQAELARIASEQNDGG